MKNTKYIPIIIFITSLSIFTSFNTSANSIEQAKQAMKNNNHSKAKLILNDLIKTNSNKAEAYLLLSRIHMASDNYDEAEEFIEKALELEPKNDQYWLQAAGIYGAQAQASSIFSKLGYAKDSKRALENAVKFNPKSEGAIRGLIQFNRRAPGIAGGDEDEIPELLIKLKALNPIGAVTLEAYLLKEDGKPEEAYKLFGKALKKHPDSIQLLFSRGMLLQNDKKYQQSFADLDKAGNTPITEQLSNQQISDRNMALYQSAKTAILGKINLEKAKKNLYQYMDLSEKLKIVDEPWIRFRLAQLLIFSNQVDYGKAQLDLIKTLKPDEDLKKKIREFKKNL